MIVWPKQPEELAYDTNGFRQNLQALIIKRLKTENTTRDAEKSKRWEEWLGRIKFGEVPQQTLKELVREGIPDGLRQKVWPHLCQQFEQPTADYQSLLKEGAFLHSQTIVLDLTRTFPNNIHFNQESTLFKHLSNVLNVLSVAFPVMGYCQGLNFICAVVLLKLSE